MNTPVMEQVIFTLYPVIQILMIYLDSGTPEANAMYKSGIMMNSKYIILWSHYKFISFSGNEYSSYGTGNIYLVSCDSNTNDLLIQVLQKQMPCTNQV